MIPNETDVLNRLSWHDGRTPLELADGIAKDYRAGPLRYFAVLGLVHLRLNGLTAEGYVEGRERVIDSDTLRARNGYHEFEFRLTDSGLQKRIELY